MFKPVTGDQLSQFDAETIDLYRKRKSNPIETLSLMDFQRKGKNHLPLPVSQDQNPMIVANDNMYKSLWWKVPVGYLCFHVAFSEFLKIYFPGGIIVRRSIP